jgi:hypothetical protein
VTKYDIAAELLPETHFLKANVRIEFTPATDLTQLSFEFHRSLNVEKILDAKGETVDFRRSGSGLRLSPSSALPAGKRTFLTFSYSGTLASADGSPVENLKLAYVGPEGSYLLYSGRWFPVSEQGLVRFAASMQITVPSDETVIASGKASPPIREPEKTTYSYQFDEPSFPGTVLAGRYVVLPSVVGGAEIALYMKPGHESVAVRYGQTAAKIMAFYSDKFGPLPNGQLAIVEIEDGTVGGYTAPGLVALASRGFSTQVNYRLLAQEISHQWWRCLVSPASRNDMFLDEGLATYSAALYLQEAVGETTFEDLMWETEVGALTHEEVVPIAQSGHLREYTPEYQSIILQKGAMVFHMLRWVIGDNAFFATLRSLLQENVGKPVSTDSFRAIVHRAAGQDLGYFFTQWLDSTNVPEFRWAFSTQPNGDRYRVTGKLQQDLDSFRMPVEVRIYTEGGAQVNKRFDMAGRGGVAITIDLPTRPLRVIVDPASRILKYDDKLKLQVAIARGDQLVQEQAYLEAIKQYQSALELSKNLSLVHYRIGEIYFKVRQYTASMEEFRRALDGDLDPKWTSVWSHLMLGKIFDVTGQRDRALNEYQRALQTNDNTQSALDEANSYVQRPYAVVETGRSARRDASSGGDDQPPVLKRRD